MVSTAAFFSLFDPRLRPSGSRDPLGIEAIWGHIGRKLVGNLTTVTADIDNFYVALLASHYANLEPGTETPQRHERFIRMEQVFAYLRIVASDKDFHKSISILGVTEARKRLRAGGETILLGTAYPLLSGALRAGLWGLYTPALERSGLIKDNERRLSSDGNLLVSKLIDDGLGDHWKALCEVCESAELSTCQLEILAQAVAALLEENDLRKTMVSALLHGAKSSEIQTALYDQAQLFLRGWEPGTGQRTRAFLSQLQSNNSQPDLSELADQILKVEPILVITNRVFRWLQSRHDATVMSLEKDLNTVMDGIKLELPNLQGIPHKEFLREAYEAITKPDAAKLIGLVIQQNKQLMSARGGASWMEVRSENGAEQIHVRMVDNSGSLPKSLNELSRQMDNSYFIGSFLNIANAINHKETAE